MSINFAQFPVPTVIGSTDKVVGYQIVTGVPTLAQYTMLQLAGVIGALIPSEPPSGPAGGDLSGTYPNPTVSAVHATSGTLDNVPVGATTPSAGNFTTLGSTGAATLASLTVSGTVAGTGFTTLLAPYGLKASPLSQFAATTSAQLAGVISDETGTGSLVFGTSPTVTTPNIVGVSTNSNAPAGSVGEFISSSVVSGSAVPLTNGVVANVTSISLTPGDWDVWGQVSFLPAGTTTVTFVSAGLNTISATFPLASDPHGGYSFIAAPLSTGQGQNVQAGRARISIAATTTVFLLAWSGFLVSTMGAFGHISARRVR